MEKQQMREKLVELLQYDNCPLFMVFGDKVDVLADYLIAHGVTVQEWISVKDRLPEDNQDVLGYMQNSIESRIFPANYYKGRWEDCIWNTQCLSVTHWMPLPQPPKGG